MMVMQKSLEAYISRELIRIYKGHNLVATNEILPGGVEIDFHFKDNEGKDIFVDVKSSKIDRSTLSGVLNLYSSISNIYPSLKNFELVVVGPEVASPVRELEGLSIRLLTFRDLGITRKKLGQIKEDLRQMRIRNLSPDEARLVAKWEAEKRSTLRAVDIQNALDRSLDYSYVLLHSLEKKGWIERIKNGVYQFVPAGYGLYPNKVPPANPFAVGTVLVAPYYFSYYTANSHYGFTTQMPFTYFIATTKKKTKVEWQSASFEFVTISKRKFFGFVTVKVFDIEVCMASQEKSIVDSFDKPRYAGGIEQLARVVWRGLPWIDQGLLVDYALRMKSHSLVQRLGFMVDFLANEGLVKPLSSDLRQELKSYVGQSVFYLDSRKPKKGVFFSEWNIMNNVSRAQLLSEIEVR